MRVELETIFQLAETTPRWLKGTREYFELSVVDKEALLGGYGKNEDLKKRLHFFTN